MRCFHIQNNRQHNPFLNIVNLIAAVALALCVSTPVAASDRFQFNADTQYIGEPKTSQQTLRLEMTSESVPAVLLDTQSFYPLAGHFEQLIDSTGKLALADILKPEMAARFVPIPGNMNRGYTRDTVWLRFTVQRTAAFPAEARLRLVPPYLDEITVYQQTGSNPVQPSSYRVTRLGDHIPTAERTYLNIDFVAPLVLQTDRPATVYLQVRSTSTVCLEGYLQTRADLIRQGSTTIMYQGGYFGIALIISLINLIIFLRIRDRVFLYFGLYILAICINHMGIQGMLPLIWPDSAHLVSHPLIGMSSGSVYILFSCFLCTLFDTPRYPWVHRYLMFVALMGILTILSVPLDFYGPLMSLTFFSLIITLLLMLGLSIVAIRQREPAGTIYLIAFGVSSFGYIAHLLRLLGLVPLAWWNIHTIQFSTLLNMVLMTLALTERLHAAEQKALQTVRKSEQKAVELATEMTAELRIKQQELEGSLASEQYALKQSKRFLAMLSHEYRTPLAIIRANLNLLEQREEQTGAPREPRITTMQHAVDRLVEVMEVSLRKDRLESPDEQKLFEPVQLIQLIDELIDQAEVFWPDRLFVFDPDSLETEVAVTGDTGQLKTALLNLLDNACKYSPEDAPVTIDCRIEGEMAAVSIHDQGKGFSLNEAEGLFEKYRRGSSSQGTSGAGIGLWLVRQIAEQHGGSITLAPSEGGGAVATLWLPLSL